MNFELLSIFFMRLVDERYPSAEKILQIFQSVFPIPALSQDTLEAIRMKIILLGLVRDGVKEVSPTYVYRSAQHRDDLYAALIEALEELEDQLEEKEEQEGLASLEN